jgi:hypothetical protein
MMGKAPPKTAKKEEPKFNKYRVTNRVSGESYQVGARDEDSAYRPFCSDAGWGPKGVGWWDKKDCDVELLEDNIGSGTKDNSG